MLTPTLLEISQALPVARDGTILFEYEGVVDGVHCYAWHMPHHKLLRIRVKTGIDRDSRWVGQAIRFSLQMLNNRGNWQDVPGTADLVNPMPEWETRLNRKIKHLFRQRVKVIKQPLDPDKRLKFECKTGKPYQCCDDGSGHIYLATTLQMLTKPGP